MPQHKSKVMLQGPITVAYHREDGEWFATALEFDIIGYGKTRAKALKLLQELLLEYLHEAARSLIQKENISFFNPSDEGLWNNNEGTETLFVRLTFTAVAPAKQLTGLGKLREFIDSLGDLDEDALANVELVPSDC